MTLVSLLPCEQEHRDGWESFAKDHFSQVIETDCRRWLPSDIETESVLRRKWSNAMRLASPLPRVIQNWQSKGLRAFFRDLRQRVQYDVAWIDRSYVATVARRAGFESIVIDVDEVETAKVRRALTSTVAGRDRLWRQWDAAKLSHFERRLPRHTWRVVVCKEEDRSYFDGSRGNVFVVPNGILEGSPATLDAANSGRLLFVGAMDYGPNDDAACWFAERILPLINQRSQIATFDIVGQHPGPQVTALNDGACVKVHGRVPEVAPYYQDATVVVAPIRQGSGTRLKVLEALSNGKALVATDVAVEGLGLRPGVDFELANSSAEFADACVRLLKDPPKRLRLGDSGRQSVLQRFRWDAVSRMAEAAITPDAEQCTS